MTCSECRSPLGHIPGCSRETNHLLLPPCGPDGDLSETQLKGMEHGTSLGHYQPWIVSLIREVRRRRTEENGPEEATDPTYGGHRKIALPAPGHVFRRGARGELIEEPERYGRSGAEIVAEQSGYEPCAGCGNRVIHAPDCTHGRGAI